MSGAAAAEPPLLVLVTNSKGATYSAASAPVLAQTPTLYYVNRVAMALYR